MAHMIEETDSVVYLQGTPVPWHGLATELPPNLSAVEACVHSKLDWTVGREPIYRYSGDHQVVNGYKALVRNDTNTVLDVVSNVYEPFQNLEAFAIFQNVLDTGLVKLNTAGSLKGGKVVWAYGELVGAEDVVTTDDIVRRNILLSWGHYKGRSVKFGLVDVRPVCNNTITMAENTGDLIRILHKGNVQDNVERIVKSLDVATQSFKVNVEMYRKMLNTGINQDDLVKFVRVSLAVDPEKTKGKNLIDKVVSLAEHGIGNKGYGSTLWGAFNAVTEYVSHHAARTQDNRVFNMWWGSGAQVTQRALDQAKALMAA